MDLQRHRVCFFCKISIEMPYLIHSYLCKSYNYYQLYDRKLLSRNREFILELFQKYRGGYPEYRVQFNDKNNSMLKKYFKFDDTCQIATNTIRKCSLKPNKIIMHYDRQFYVLLKKNEQEKDKIKQKIMKGYGERLSKKMNPILIGIKINKSNSSEQLRFICSKIGQYQTKVGIQKKRVLFEEFQKIIKKKNKSQLKRQLTFKKSLQNKHSQIVNEENFIYNQNNPEILYQNTYGLLPKRIKNAKVSIKKNYQKKRMSGEPTNSNTLSIKNQKTNQKAKPTNMRASGKLKCKKQKLHRSKSADKKLNCLINQKNGVFKTTQSRFKQFSNKK